LCQPIVQTREKREITKKKKQLNVGERGKITNLRICLSGEDGYEKKKKKRKNKLQRSEDRWTD